MKMYDKALSSSAFLPRIVISGAEWGSDGFSDGRCRKTQLRVLAAPRNCEANFSAFFYGELKRL